MTVSEELDLRTVLKQPTPVLRAVDQREVYEIRFSVFAREGPGGSTSRLEVLRSVDGGTTWRPLRFRRNWRSQWWAIVKDGLGGGWWPPAGDYFLGADIKDGKLAIAYCNLYELGPRGRPCTWEMQYDPAIDRWNLSMLEEVCDTES